jgi:hypothetical protein
MDMQAFFHNENSNNLIMTNTTNNSSNKFVNKMEIKLTNCVTKTINIVVDVDELKDMYLKGRLKGAGVFGYLFGIDENTPFHKNDDIVTEVDLNYFNITYNNWLLIYGFLRTGYVTPLLDERRRNANIENCYETALKLGGIPSFDLYYKECIKNYLRK